MNETVCNLDMHEDLTNILKKFVRTSNLGTEKPKTYIDIQTAITNPLISKKIVNHIIKRMIADKIAVDYIACSEFGGVLIAGLLSFDTELPLIMIRKEKNEYGQFIGNFEKGKTVLFIENVTITGRSSIEAISILRKEGLIVDKIIVIVDMDKDAGPSLTKEGIEFIPLTTLNKILKKL